jgi:hypothetical protein
MEPNTTLNLVQSILLSSFVAPSLAATIKICLTGLDLYNTWHNDALQSAKMLSLVNHISTIIAIKYSLGSFAVLLSITNAFVKLNSKQHANRLLTLQQPLSHCVSLMGNTLWCFKNYITKGDVKEPIQMTTFKSWMGPPLD